MKLHSRWFGMARAVGLALTVAISTAATLTPAPSAARASVRAAAANVHGAWSFVSSPGLHPPSVAVTARAAGTAPGYVFVAPLKSSALPGAMAGQRGPLILDDAGDPVWQHPLPRGQTAMNFQPQTYRGEPVLTWWQGKISPRGYGTGADVIVDRSYRTVAVVHAGNGYQADLHDFHITAQGTALLTAYKPVRRNLSAYRGPANGQVLDSVVQEIDIRTGRVIFQWDPLAHVSLSESYTRPYRSEAWDAFHVNSVDVDGSGKLLISARNTWAVYAVSHRSGGIYWRLGGRRSSFSLGTAVRFAYQHDARFAPGGTISLFDNGASPPVERQSRGIVVRLDLRHRAAHLAHQYTHSKALLAGSQGNTQLLPNGDVFEGWGAAPYYSEFSASGQLLYDAHFHGPDQSYRAFRAAWTGRPDHPPSIGLRPGGGGATTVYASWNGATDVATWQVLGGSSPDALKVIASAPRAGFETAVPAASAGPYFAARALDANGGVLGTSAAVKP